MGDGLVAFLLACGAALSVLVAGQAWKANRQSRQQFRELPPGVRRSTVRAGVGTVIGMVAAAGLIYGAYELGSASGDSRTGAAFAIGAFVVAAVIFFAVVVMLGRREADSGRAGSTRGR
jgi:hypothetical protein